MRYDLKLHILVEQLHHVQWIVLLYFYFFYEKLYDTVTYLYKSSGLKYEIMNDKE